MLEHFLFVEKYRPKTIEECILPSGIKQTFAEYITKGELPNFLLSGSQGQGKCLDYDTKIEIMIFDEITNIKIGELFSRLDLMNIEYESPKENNAEIYIKTPMGRFTKILAFVRKNAQAIRVITESNKTLIAAANHIVITRKGQQFLKDANELGNIEFYNDGNIEVHTFDDIISKEYLGYRDLYDISIESPHLYVDTNGFIHHNTTVARALCNQVNAEVLFINGSEETGIDVLRNKIRSFASSMSLTDSKKIVIIDESEYLSASAQPGLRAFMEEFAINCRFILTCNYKNRLISPIHSRCQVIDFVIPKEEIPSLKSQFLKRIVAILSQEHITYDIKSIVQLIENFFPDYRRILNEIQRYSVAGHIDSGILLNLSQESYRTLFNLLKNKKYTETRKWVTNNNDTDINKIFNEIYIHSDNWLTKESIPQLVLTLAKYQYQASFVANQEINLLACLTEIMSECNFS